MLTKTSSDYTNLPFKYFGIYLDIIYDRRHSWQDLQLCDSGTGVQHLPTPNTLQNGQLTVIVQCMLRQTFTINTYSSSSSWFYHVNQRVPYTGRIRFDKNSSQYLSIHAMTMYYIVTDIYVWRCRVIEQFYYVIS